MALLEWNDTYSVGFARMDQEHQMLIDMINKAYDAVENQSEHDVLAGLVDDMKRYALEHFFTEEELMRAHDYPEYKAHKKQHSEFLLKAALTDSKLDDDQGVDPIGVFRFLADWLKGHILTVDKKLGAYLREASA